MAKRRQDAGSPAGSGRAAKKAGAAGPSYVLRLHVAGINPRSAAAIRAITEVCEQYLPGRYGLEVVDIYQQPALAQAEQVVAAPTLIKKLPLPLRRLIGNLTDRERILVGLDLRPKK